MSNGWIKTSHISCQSSQRRKCKTDDTTPIYKQISPTTPPPTKSPPPPPRKAKKNDIVTISFTLSTSGRFVAEPLFDTSGTLSFILGGGNHLPGIHSLIENMPVGTTVQNVPIDAGWGERDPSLVAKVPKERHGELDYETMAVGTELVMQTGYPCVVTEVTEEYFVIDANPPLAGATYDCDLTLRAVESAPGPDELMYRAERGEATSRFEVATFALGCFWGGELAFMREPGVVGTKVGYTQGDTLNPTYEEVCSGSSGHAEAIQVVFDPEVVTFERLVNLAIERLGDSIFLLNQVGNDVGTQYRHGVYYHNDEQKDMAHKMLDNLGGSKTEILPAVAFYDAEEYHQQYLLKGGQSAKKGTSDYIRCYG